MKWFWILLVLFITGCKEYYDPPAITDNPGFLVVDGFLNGGGDSTYIKLSHTRNLNDTGSKNPELNASILVEGDQHTQIPLINLGDGRYSNLLPLIPSEKYRITIQTSDGSKYQSDYTPFKITPAIDGVYWEEDSTDVRFFLNTHDHQS